MHEPAAWFFALLMLVGVALVTGWLLGRKDNTRAWVTMFIALGCICLWSWLQRNPAVSSTVIPANALQYLEGTLAVPFFMVIVGVAWARSVVLRQRLIIGAGALAGLVFFLQGGAWMIQATPVSALEDSVPPARVVMQSQEYSCVSAASATALNLMGHYSTEAQMAVLTNTRPGTGATAVRAAYGLQSRLTGSGVKVRMVEASVNQLALLPTPMLLTVNFDHNQGYNHMIVLMHVNAHGAQVADPQDGLFFVPWSAFRTAIAGPAIVFDRSDTQHALAN